MKDDSFLTNHLSFSAIRQVRLLTEFQNFDEITSDIGLISSVCLISSINSRSKSDSI